MRVVQQHINEVVILEAIDDIGEKIGPTYESKIVNVLDTDTISISWPKFDRFIVPFPPGTKIRITFKDILKERFCLIGVITSRIDENSQKVLHSKLFNAFDQDQRRLSFRLKVRIDALYRVCYSDVENYKSTQDDIDFKKTFTKDISSGGLSLVVDEDINENTTIEVTIFLDRSDQIVAFCKIARKELIKTTHGEKYELGLSFIKISNKDQDTLIKYIFEHQRDELKSE